MSTTSTNRINYIDALRGFTMFLVVFGHVMLTSFDIGGYDSVIGSIFLTFRMPLFFFIAGIFSYKATSFWNIEFFGTILKNKFLVQIIPTLFFASTFILCHNTNPFIEFSRYGFGGYWFTIVLFEMFIIYYSISIISKYTSHKICDITLISLSILGVIIVAFFKQESRLWDILCMENLTKYFQFFVLGILCKKHFHKFTKITNNHLFRGATIITYIICLLLYFNLDFKNSFPLAFKGVHDILVRYAGLLVIYITFYHYQDFFNKDTCFNRALLFIGRRTLDIYLIHYFLLPNLQFLKPLLEPTNMMLIQFTLATLISIIIIFLCLLISNVIRTSDYLGHYLLGAKLKR